MQRLHNDSKEMFIAEDIFARHPFALMLLGKGSTELPEACHLPFLYDQQDHAFYCHVAAGNPIATMLRDSMTDAKIVFSAEHSYISPTWSPEIKVPTWDYCVIHVNGKAEIIEDEQQKRASMVRQIAAFESDWQLDDLAPEIQDRLFKAIKVIRIDISEMRYRYKMSQNKSTATKQAISEQLKVRDNIAMVMRYHSLHHLPEVGVK